MWNWKAIVLGVGMLTIVGLTGCGDAASGTPEARTRDPAAKPAVVATTTMIADLVRTLAADEVELVGLMKTGEDPHKYDVRPRDAQTIERADLVLMNGMNLEATLARVVDSNAKGKVVRLAESPGVEPLREEGSIEGALDPHAWMSVRNYRGYVEAARVSLVELVPAKAEAIGGRAEAYLRELDALDAEVRAMLESVPAERRVIVTSHDAFNYFAKEYGVEVHGVVGISTDQQPRPQDIEALISLVKARGVRALFIETSVSQKLNDIIAKVASETGARVGGSLFSDSLGEPGEEGGTYLGMMRHNTRTIAEALR